VDHLA
jgi:hypothetical protein